MQDMYLKDGRNFLYVGDVGRKLVINLPNLNIIRVCYETKEGFTKDVKVENFGEVLYADIPDLFLSGEYSALTCYAIATDGEYAYTASEAHFEIKDRQKSEGYSPTEQQLITWDYIERKAAAYMQQTEIYMNHAEELAIHAGNAADSALQSKNASEQSEANARQSETNSKASEEAAKLSKTNAKASEEAAKQSEDNAQTSADNAESSADSALQSKNASSQSEANARQSEINAKASETAAKQSETNAKASEEAAKQSEDNAHASAENAESSADSALQSKNASAQSEANAKLSETNAKASETAAKQSLAEAQQIVASKADKTYVDSNLATKADKSELAVERARIDSLSTLPEGSTTGDAELIGIRIGADGVTYPNAGEAVRTQILNEKTSRETAVNELKGDLSKWIRLEGVTIKDGTDLSPLIIESGEHGYYSNNGVITPITYNDFKYFKLPIDGGNTYYLDNSFRWAFTTDTDGNVVDSDNVGSERIITSDNAVMLWVTYNKVNLPEYRKIAKGSSPTDTIFEIPSNVVLVNADTDTDTDNISNGIVSKTGTFSASGDNILLSNARSNLRKGIRLVFEATVTSGTDFEIGFSISESSANTYPHNIISVTSDNISYNKVNYPHGLSITGRLQMLFEYLSDGTADITLLSNGNVFKQNVPFSMESVAVPYVKSNGLIATDCKFTFICTDIRKKIWMFGDSYVAYSNKRWTYYLKEYGYDTNVLLDGFPGIGSVNARVSFAKLLSLGKPSYAIWFMGMNDGTDTDDTTPNANWVTQRDDFIALCKTNGIEPIFATIPNVPSINHKGKNKWIRESGYRYIDMCHAVGADVDVNWYGDMLSSDKVHPSESGAKALFAQVLLDLPEVMLDNL